MAPQNGFSFEEVSLKVEELEARSVTFVDLPGIIHTAEQNQSKEIVQQVKNLTMQYIARDNAIVLCVVDLTKDLEMNAIFQLIGDVDQNGRRTIIVFTKVDKCMSDPQKLEAIIDEVKTKKRYHNYKHFFFVDSSLENTEEDTFLRSKFIENIKSNHITAQSKNYISRFAAL